MLSKNKIKYLRSLKVKKFRQMYNKFVVEGDKMARELLSYDSIDIECLVATAAWCDKYLKNKPAYEVIMVTEAELKKVSNLHTPNQVLVVASILNPSYDNQNLNQSLSLYLDGIQDPGNLGTILRIADWFGIKNVFYSAGGADLYNPKVIQSTMGAFLRVAYIEKPLADLLSEYPDLPCYGTVLDGVDVFQADLSSQGIIVIGSEGRGISPANLALLTHRLSIARPESGGAESLNAGVATGIICAAFSQK